MTLRWREFREALGTAVLLLTDFALVYERVRYGHARRDADGCVRLRNEDIAKLYAMVPVGTPVYIY